MRNRLASLLLCFCMLICFVSCNRGPRFSHAELAIMLPDSFHEMESEDFDAAFTDGQTAVGVLRISFAAALVEGIPETFDESEFGRFWLVKCNRAAAMQKKNGVNFCEYSETVSGEEYYYLAAFYRSMNAYFVVLFGTEAQKEFELRDTFLEYAGGVYFTDN